ncbi:MAG TPA: hypothetical protein VFN13_03625 [Rudaea sp.]|nr:hypothetical protein [Rudaea sp.]
MSVLIDALLPGVTRWLSSTWHRGVVAKPAGFNHDAWLRDE